MRNHGSRSSQAETDGTIKAETQALYDYAGTAAPSNDASTLYDYAGTTAPSSNASTLRKEKANWLCEGEDLWAQDEADGYIKVADEEESDDEDELPAPMSRRGSNTAYGFVNIPKEELAAANKAGDLKEETAKEVAAAAAAVTNETPPLLCDGEDYDEDNSSSEDDTLVTGFGSGAPPQARERRESLDFGFGGGPLVPAAVPSSPLVPTQVSIPLIVLCYSTCFVSGGGYGGCKTNV